MVVPALVDAPPGLIRRRWSPVLATIATGIPAGPAAAITWATARPTRPTRAAPAAWALLGSTRSTRASGTSWPAVRSARPARTLLGTTGTLLGSTRSTPVAAWAALSTRALATLKTTGRRTGLRCRDTGTEAQTAQTHCDRYRATAGQTLDIHHEHPFEALNDL
jgi:hypothetical protein